MLPKFYIDEIILTALKEDINYIDVSADTVIPAEQDGAAVFLAKADGVLCGIDVAMRVFELLDSTFKVEVFKKDGDKLQKGDIIAKISGKTALLLKGERTALNLLQHMSGIASATSAAVKLVEGTRTKITDTRKTLPGLRALQKYAVTCGGGYNHRFNLSDGAMLKDNHIDACGGIPNAVKTIRTKLGHMVKVEVETRNMQEVKQAVEAGADIIMLDNFDYAMTKEAVEFIGGRALVESSGGITLETLSGYAQCGVDIISIGALTHSVKALDISMKFRKGE